MSTVKLVLTIIQVVVGLGLSAIILLQSGKRSGLSGAIAGGADTFMTKAKATTLDGKLALEGLESCREEARREVFVDGLSKQPTPTLAAYLQHDAVETDAEALAKATAEGMVVVPPQAKASMVVRDVVAAAIGKIDADTVTEELVRVEAVDLYYRPIHAFRYRRADKEAVVEFDAVTGEARVGGDTFEQYLGKALEPRFLLDVGAETLNFVVPGANLAKLIIVKGMEMKGMRPS